MTAPVVSAFEDVGFDPAHVCSLGVLPCGFLSLSFASGTGDMLVGFRAFRHNAVLVPVFCMPRYPDMVVHSIPLSCVSE